MAVGGSPRRARRLSSTRRPGAPPEQRSDLCAYLLKTNMAGAWFPTAFRVGCRLSASRAQAVPQVYTDCLPGFGFRLSTLGFRLSAFGFRGEISRLKVVTNPPE